MHSYSLGYDDTPIIPGTEYRVHDGSRPQPPVVEPDPIPSDAVILFSPGDLSGWISRNNRGPAPWQAREDYLEVVPGSGNIISRQEFADCQLHIEWAAPADLRGDSQGRGNSGIFMLGLYEVQVLDGYRNPTYADGTTGAIYGQQPPLVNPCRPPGQWQSFEIIWISPRFSGDRLTSPARITVFLNGVLLHHNQTLLGPTQHRKLAAYEPHPVHGPLELQDHGDLVRFRNIWYRPL